MNKYHKIVTVYERDPETKYKYLIEGRFAKPEFAYLSEDAWIWSEKIDGTNIRVMWDDDKIRYGGKTDNAQIPAFLLHQMDELFSIDIFSKLYPDNPLCLYGEGFGDKIQKKGKEYLRDSQSFILFDVRIGDVWLERHNVEDVAEKLGVQAVPIIGTGSLNKAVEYVRNGFASQVAKSFALDTDAEGLVMRPEVELFDRLGHRIITKIKYKDFPHD
jgi:ATP-dependent RNA circularization protein (DNA/RNA ligase family)